MHDAFNGFQDISLILFLIKNKNTFYTYILSMTNRRFLIAVFISVCVCARGGTFQYGNRICNWIERRRSEYHLRFEDGGPRILAINCPRGQQGEEPINCRYKGNPHSCRAYNRQQMQYYQCLADTLAKYGNLCTRNTVFCQSLCDEITFNLQ
jgi:hypothetical protein